MAIQECLKLFGTRLKRLRQVADLSQTELAEKLDVGVSAVNKYEKLNNAFPSMPVLLKLSEIFEVTTDYLLKGINTSSTVENNVNGDVTNSSVIQANQCGMAVINQAYSPEAEELANIYTRLKGKERIKLLNYAVKLEEATTK